MDQRYAIRKNLDESLLEDYLRLAHGFLKKPMHVGIEDEDKFVQATYPIGQKLLADPNTHIWVAWDHDHESMVGYVACNIHPALHVNSVECMVRELFVRPQHRRNGIGRALLAGVEAYARRCGCKRVSLATNLGNDEQRLFYNAVDYNRRCDFATKSL